MFGKKRQDDCGLRIADCGLKSAERTLRRRARSFRNPKSAIRISRRPRRGVLLLVVLSLLVLFLMVGTAFIITAKQSEITAKISNKVEQTSVNAAARGNLLDEVLMQIVRDTDNPASVLRGSSLLADLYGNDGFQFQITKAQWAKPSSYPDVDGTNPAPNFVPRGGVTQGQMLQFEVDTTADLSQGSNYCIVDLYGAPYQFNSTTNLTTPSLVDGAYSGQVVTFVTGEAKGISTRIVDYHPVAPTRWQFTVVAFPLNGAPIDDPTANQTAADKLLSALNGSRVVVNGRPFNGTGVGYNPYAAAGDPKLDAIETIPGILLPTPIALLPNPVFHGDPSGNSSNIKLLPFTGANPGDRYLPANSGDWTGRGGADETYDAADFQNMFLAVMPDAPSDSANPALGTLGSMVLPSFHRPELINFWNAQITTGLITAKENSLLLRKVLLRPNHLDHPHFTGSNAQYAASLLAMYPNGGAAPSTDTTIQGQMLNSYVYGPWDVDNDNDGVRDSVWVDVGLPVVVGPNGKLVKPLAAILCVDLDGRVNVNAHGSADLAGVLSVPPVSAAQAVPLAGTAGTMSNTTPRGVGWGPADISLEAAIGPDSFKRLFNVPGGGGSTIPGRLGRDGGAGRGLTYDHMSQVNEFGWPQWGLQAIRSTFAMPPDFRSRYGTALNAFGQVVLEATTNAETSGAGPLSGDSPYETQFYAEGIDSYNGAGANDAPFSLAELERVLRAYDSDNVATPSRLSSLANVPPAERNRITTDSWDLPSPNIAMPPELETLVAPLVKPNNQPNVDPVTNQLYRRLPHSAAELLEIRVRATLNTVDPAKYPLFPVPLAGDPSDLTTPLGRVRVIMRQILAPELAAGLRLNINRPLGNGRDDNNNGVVDEPGEDGVTTPTGAWANSQTSYSAEGLAADFLNAAFRPLDVTFDGDPNPGVINDADAMLQRQLLARHLYVLAITMTAPPDFGKTTPPSQAEQDYCRRLAQWAVNAVDFRDSDSIMTPFEYDLNPFDGWQPDGDLRTTADHFGPDGQMDPPPMKLPDDTFVWGAERPDLLMTETLAWHDRRTEDLGDEDAYPPSDNAEKMDSNDPFKEPDYDQRVRPRGALFIELYNPSSPTPGASADTHAIVDASGKPIQISAATQAYDLGVDLQAVDSLTKNSPVWRFAIYKRGTKQIDKDAALWDPDARNATPAQYHVPTVPMDRSVYFTGFDPQSRNPGWDNDGVAFFANPGPKDANGRLRNVGTVRPGRYLVVGSGDNIGDPGNPIYSSPLGDRTPTQQGLPPGPPQRRIELLVNPIVGDPQKGSSVRFNDDGNVTLNDPNGGFAVQAPAQDNSVMEPVPGDAPSRCVSDVAIIDYVDDVVDNYGDDGLPSGPKPRRLTLSEPARGYIDQFANTKWNKNPGGGLEPRYTPSSIDIPLDGPLVNWENLGDRLKSDLNPAFSGDPSVPFPIPEYLRASKVSSAITIDPALVTLGPIKDDNDPRIAYAFIYLQRLANPTLPWNPEPGRPGYDNTRQVNPYLTIDGMSSNLNVFNGRQQADGVRKASEEEDGTVTREQADKFASLERGFPQPGDTHAANLWRRQRPSTRSNMQRNLYNGLASTRSVYNRVPFASLGFLNSPFQNPGGGSPAQKQLQPKVATPLTWISWNNRPYVSGNELFMVPRLRSSQLAYQFDVGPGTTPLAGIYGAPIADRLPTAPAPASPAPFPYLENLLYAFQPPTPGAPNPAPQLPQNLYRLLDLVGTPSLFTGATAWFNPMTVGALPLTPTGTVTATTAYEDPRMDRQAPFNNVSMFREPGRINLNTIFSAEVYAGLFHGKQGANAADVQPAGQSTGPSAQVHPGPTWSNGNASFIRSRRGYDPTDISLKGHIFALDPQLPTFFANPFRSANAGDLVPLPGMVRAGVEGTLTRSTSVTGRKPDGTFAIDPSPLFAADTQDPYRDRANSPYFDYQPIVRLNNLTTARSNVFAVWVTIGYFEVEPADFETFKSNNPKLTDAQDQKDMFNRVYPEGYQFAAEDGLDEGKVHRLRGFYIIDRSRPAAFQPGVDNNVEQTIRLHRRIE